MPSYGKQYIYVENQFLYILLLVRGVSVLRLWLPWYNNANNVHVGACVCVCVHEYLWLCVQKHVNKYLYNKHT